MESLPFEIMEEITNKLTIADFHRLRICSKKLQLPVLPTYRFEPYLTLLEQYEFEQENIQQIMKLEMGFISHLQLYRLIRSGLSTHLLEILNRPSYPTYSQKVYQKAFDLYFKKDYWAKTDHKTVYEICKGFILHKVDPSTNFNEALIVGCISGNVKLVNLLLHDSRAGVDNLL
jgi:hypothetical protein